MMLSEVVFASVSSVLLRHRPATGPAHPGRGELIVLAALWATLQRP